MSGPVFDAWTSEDLAQMLSVLDVPARPVDRHFLLQSIVEKTYKYRNDPVMREVCVRIGRRHLSEFPKLKGPLKRSVGGFMPRVSTFENLAMVLTENGEYEEAVRIAESAVRYDVFDDTFVDDVKRRIDRMERSRRGRLKKVGRNDLKML